MFNASALQKMFQDMSPMNMINKVLGNGFGQIERNILMNIGGGMGGMFGGQGGQAIQGIQNNFSNGTFGNAIGSVFK